MPTNVDTHIVQCQNCGTKYRTKNEPAQRVQCSRCGNVWLDWHYPSLIGEGYKEFWNFKGRYAIVKGSRGSKKSKTIALWIITHMTQYPEANTLVIRKVGQTLKDSCFSDLKWAIRRLLVESEWKCTTNPLEMVRVTTGQKILFRGCDDALKLTSISVPEGVLCWAWFEEFYEITNEEEFNKIDDSIRGIVPDGYFKHILGSFNPWSEKIWLKKRFFDCPNDEEKLAITTNYLCNSWLDDKDRKRMEDMIKNNPKRARVAAFGEWGIADGLIYENWEEFAFNLDDVKKINGIKFGFGLDFGFTNSSTALCCFAVDEKEKRVFVFDEMYGKEFTNQKIAEKIIAMGYRKETIYADCAEPKSIAELREAGIYNVRPASKGKTINFGIQLIQGYRIIIHPHCVNFITEISMYCWNEDKSGKKINEPVKENDHLMDALRYGMIAVSQGDRFSWD